MDTETTIIDVDAMANTAFIGVNRVWLFMGLGVNCANDARSMDFDVPDAGYLRLLPEDLPKATLQEAKAEFGIWIISNGLREAIDTFEVYLGYVNSAALTIEAWNAARAGTEVARESLDKRARKFSMLGTADRLTRIQDEFGITADYTSDIISVHKARNCLTHRLGVVGHKDVGEDSVLVLRWHIVELFGVHPDGSEFVPSLDELPVTFPVDSPVSVRHAAREKRFSLGERLVLSPGDLKHICYTFRLAIEQVRLSFVEFAKRSGVQELERGEATGETST